MLSTSPILAQGSVDRSQSQTADRDPTLDLLSDVEGLMRGIYVPEELTDQEVANLIVRTVCEDCHASEGLI